MKNSPLSFMLVLVMFITSSCKKENAEEIVILQQTEYIITPFNGSNIRGTATFTEDSNGSTFILIELTGSNTAEHPAFIRFDAARDNGENAITLEVCTCQISKTLVTKLDNGNIIDYDDLVRFNGHIAILENKTDDTVVAVANIGRNAIQK